MSIASLVLELASSKFCRPQASRGHFDIGPGRFALSHVMKAEIRFISSDKAGTRRLP